MKRRHARALPLLMAGIGLLGTYFCRAAAENDENNFPYVIQFELGEAEFAPGDAIKIQGLRGTKEQIAPGGTYLVTGTYALSSREEATLAWYVTTTNVGPSTFDPRQVVRVKKGTGSFRLVKPLTQEGYLHVTFYPVPSGSGFGGVYFGQGNWVLRNKGFSYLVTAGKISGDLPPRQIRLSGPNLAIFEYLGEAVEPPSDLDAKYTREGLLNAVRTAAAKANVTLQKIELETSEFPFLIGIVTEAGGFEKIEDQIRKMSGYEAQGSVGSPTCHTFNIVPYSAYPRESAQRITRRGTLRSQMFHDWFSRTQ